MRLVRVLRVTTKLLAVGYLASLLIGTAMLRVVGEDWWVTCIALYLPRVGFAFPLVVLVPMLLVLRQFRLLWTQVAAALWVLFPLMGLELNLSVLHRHSEPAFRVLTLNANSGYYGYENVANSILEHEPDVVLVQEAFGDTASILEAKLRERYSHVQRSTQFIIASRFSITDASSPEHLQVSDKLRSPRFMRYLVATPLGPIAIFSVHPASPRAGLNRLCGSHCRNAFLAGRMFTGEAAADIKENTKLRETQFNAVLDLAARESLPVLIAGDTNLPSLSKLLSGALQDFDDGFSQAGFGFGYTFHKRMPWMRIDRVFTGRELRVVGFSVSCKGISDHFCVVADIARR